MTDYLTLEEADAGRRTVYTAAPCTKAARLNVLQGMRDLIHAGQTSITAALEIAGDNTDNGDTYVCRYDLRQSVGRWIAAAVSALNEAGKPATPLDIVQEAIRLLLAPPTPRKAPEPTTPTEEMDGPARRVA